MTTIYFQAALHAGSLHNIVQRKIVCSDDSGSWENICTCCEQTLEYLSKVNNIQYCSVLITH